MSAARRTARANDGFTLIELMLVMVISGVLASIGVFGFASWQATAEQQGTADSVLSQLRNASTRAVSEGRTYCVEIGSGGTTYSLYQYSCSTAAPASRVLGPKATQSSDVTISATATHPSPAPACPSGSTCVYFRPRGTATPAQMTVQSTERAKTYTITVEGLTARVFM